jgi:hypothetical protein
MFKHFEGLRDIEGQGIFPVGILGPSRKPAADHGRAQDEIRISEMRRDMIKIIGQSRQTVAHDKGWFLGIAPRPDMNFIAATGNKMVTEGGHGVLRL